MRVVIDFDQTIVASSEAIFEIYKKETNNKEAKFNKNHSWSFDGLLPENYKERAIELFCEEEFFKILKPLPNAIEVIKVLSKKHEIFIVTHHSAEGIPLKDAWIRKNLPSSIKIVYVDSFDKSIVCGDIFIDDKIECLESAKKNFKKIICFGNYEWNKEWQGVRVNNWNEIYEKINTIEY